MIGEQIELDKLLQGIKEAAGDHAIFIQTEQRGLKEELILNEATGALNGLNSIAAVLEEQNQIPVALIETFLTKRWELIRGSFLSYTSMPNSYINRCCLMLADALHRIKPAKKKMQYLMPTITHTFDKLDLFPDKESIDDYELGELILSETGDALIPVNILSFMAAGETTLPQLYKPYVKSRQDNVSLLSQDEQKRLLVHNPLGQRMHKLIEEIIVAKTKNISIGGKLFQLIGALRRGGQKGGHGGTEKNAGPDANIGINEFMSYWRSLDEEERAKASPMRSNRMHYTQKTIGEVINVLSGTDKTFIDCVEVNANVLECILKDNSELYDMHTNSRSYILALEDEFKQYKIKLANGVIGSDTLQLLTTQLFEHIDLFQGMNVIQLVEFCRKKKYEHLDTLNILENYLNSIHCSADSLKAVHDGQTVLTWAVLKTMAIEDLSLVKLILTSRYCDFNVLATQNGTKDTPLILAAKIRNNELITAITSSPHCNFSVLSQLDKDGNSALMLAAMGNYQEGVEAIIANEHFNRDLLMQKNNLGHKPLFLAVSSCRRFIVGAITRSAHCDAKVLCQSDKDGNNALMMAVRKEYDEIAKVIMTAANFNQQVLTHQNRKGDSALIVAVRRDNLNIVQAILTNPHCNSEVLMQCNQAGYSALILAAKKGHSDIVKVILNSPHCNQNMLMQQTQYGYTALIEAVHGQKALLVEVFLNKAFCSPALLMQQDKNGNNALIEAVQQGDLTSIKMILASQFCDLNVLKQKNKEGKTALDYIENEAIETLFEEKVSKLQVGTSNLDKQSQFLIASRNNFFSSVPQNESKITSQGLNFN